MTEGNLIPRYNLIPRLFSTIFNRGIIQPGFSALKSDETAYKELNDVIVQIRVQCGKHDTFKMTEENFNELMANLNGIVNEDDIYNIDFNKVKEMVQKLVDGVISPKPTINSDPNSVMKELNYILPEDIDCDLSEVNEETYDRFLNCIDLDKFIIKDLDTFITKSDTENVNIPTKSQLHDEIIHSNNNSEKNSDKSAENSDENIVQQNSLKKYRNMDPNDLGGTKEHMDYIAEKHRNDDQFKMITVNNIITDIDGNKAKIDYVGDIDGNKAIIDYVGNDNNSNEFDFVQFFKKGANFKISRLNYNTQNPEQNRVSIYYLKKAIIDGNITISEPN
jgi:hypothetical protein